MWSGQAECLHPESGQEIGLQIEGSLPGCAPGQCSLLRPVVKLSKFEAGGGGQAGLPDPALAREHEDSHILIL